MPAVEEKKRTGRRNSIRNRTLQLLDTEIKFIASKSFRKKSTAAQIEAEGKHLLSDEFDEAKISSELPAHLARLCSAKLLTPDEEVKLFRRMNFRKYQANALRSKLDPDKPDRALVRQIESLLRDSDRTRERLIRANIRLVISIARKFVNSAESFDELLSDGLLSLMQAVEKFDFERGYRFSTYAYRAITRHIYRMVMGHDKDRKRFSTGADNSVLDHVDEIRLTPREINAWGSLESQLNKMVRKLDDREQFIINSRFALSDVEKSQTFQSLANEMGLSKERVRQLEQRAIRKLREMADNKRVRELIDSAESELVPVET